MKARPYQVEGIDFLCNNRFGILGDEMGLGKTFQTTSAAIAVGARTAVTICPASIREQWRESWAAAGMPTYRVFGYEEAQKNIHSIIKAEPQVLVFDEYHYLKNPEAKRTRNLLQLAHHVPYMWGLSGTPMPNHPGELWSWLYVTGATKMGYEKWCLKFCVFDDMGRVRGGKNMDLLRQALGKFMLRRTREDVGMQLPPLEITHLRIPPGPEPTQEDIEQWYVSMVRIMGDSKADMLAKVAKQEELIKECAEANDFTAIEARLKELATVRRWYAMLKTPTVADMVTEELKAKLYNKIIIFAVHRQAIEGTRQILKARGIDCLTLYGGSRKREQIIHNFISKPKYKVLIANIAAGGIGIDGFQHACHEILFLETEWTKAANDQAIFRVYRDGQAHPVNCRVVNIGGFDELMNKTLIRKEKLMKEAGL